MRTFAAGITLLMILAVALAQAGPLDVKHVSADAKWLVHIDVDAMRSSTILQRTWKKAIDTQGQGNVAAQLAAIRDQMCMDPTSDLHGILAYGSSPGSPEGILIVHAAVDQARFIEKVTKAPGYRTGNHRSFRWHGWVQSDGPAMCAFFKPDLLVFAKTEPMLAKGLDVLDGKSQSVAAGHPLVAEPAPSGTMFLIRAIGLAGAELPFKSPLITHCRALYVAFGEHQATSFSEVNLVVKSPETADRMRAILEGLRATALLHCEDRPSLMTLVNRTQVTISGSTVKAVTSAPVDDVWAAVESLWPRSSEVAPK
jgi:hypothetical protein